MKNIGENIQKYRKMKKLTQKELADGICSQGLVSKIEKGYISPDIQTLKQISDKLGVNINYILDNTHEENIFFSGNNALLQRIIDKHEYKILEDYVDYNNSLKNNSSLSVYETWIKSLILFHNYGKKDEAISLINKITENNRLDVFSRVRLTNTLINFYIESNEFEKAIPISDFLLQELENISLDYKTVTKCLYSISLLKNKLEKYSESNSMLEKAVNILIAEDSIYNLEDHYCLLAVNSFNLEKYSESHCYNEYALFLSKIKGNKTILNICNYNKPHITKLFNSDHTN